MGMPIGKCNSILQIISTHRLKFKSLSLSRGPKIPTMRNLTLWIWSKDKKNMKTQKISSKKNPVKITKLLLKMRMNTILLKVLLIIMLVTTVQLLIVEGNWKRVESYMVKVTEQKNIVSTHQPVIPKISTKIHHKLINQVI